MNELESQESYDRDLHTLNAMQIGAYICMEKLIHDIGDIITRRSTSENINKIMYEIAMTLKREFFSEAE
jgi:hypothetical protein